MDPIAIAYIAVPLFAALLAWIVRELARTGSVLTKLEERSQDQARRIGRLEDSSIMSVDKAATDARAVIETAATAARQVIDDAARTAGVAKAAAVEAAAVAAAAVAQAAMDVKA